MQEIDERIKHKALLRNEIFTSQEYFDREIERIWESRWIFGLHASEIPGDGDYRLIQVGRQWIIVLRDQAGRIRAYHNTCRHRGAAIVRDVAGTTKQLKCVYHLWTYNLGGELLGQGAELTGVPSWKGYEDTGVCKEDFSLLEVAVREKYGLIFVNLAEDPVDFDEYFGEFFDYLEEVRHPLTQGPLEVFQYHRGVLHANWKYMGDNNREGYHGYLHHLSRMGGSRGLWSGEGQKFHLFKNGHMFFGQSTEGTIKYDRAGYDDSEGSKIDHPLPGAHRGAIFFAWLFPDIMFNTRSNAMRIDRITPLDPGRCLVEWRHLGVPGVSEEAHEARVRNVNTPWGPFGRNLPEDMMALEEQWRQVNSDPDTIAVIAREEDGGWMDDIGLRYYYEEYARVIDMPTFVKDEPR